MLRCASSFVIAAYVRVRLIPQDSRALPLELFTKPSTSPSSLIYYDIITIGIHPVFDGDPFSEEFCCGRKGT
jgi:hypothetical protein